MDQTSKYLRIAIVALLFVIAINVVLRDWLSAAACLCLLIMFGLLPRALPDRSGAARIIFWAGFAGLVVLLTLDFLRS